MSSITYVYDKSENIIIKMHTRNMRNITKHLDLFLKSYVNNKNKNEEIDMENLSDNLLSHFFEINGENTILISPFCKIFIQDCEYKEFHIYSDRIRIVIYKMYGYEEYESNWDDLTYM